MSAVQTAAARCAAEIPTPHAAKYVTQLCKHFQHKCPVTLEGAAGSIAFSIGDCRARTEDGTLVLDVPAPDAAALERLRDVVAVHLARFAFREPLAIAWHPV